MVNFNPFLKPPINEFPPPKNILNKTDKFCKYVICRIYKENCWRRFLENKNKNPVKSGTLKLVDFCPLK